MRGCLTATSVTYESIKPFTILNLTPGHFGGSHLQCLETNGKIIELKWENKIINEEKQIINQWPLIKEAWQYVYASIHRTDIGLFKV